MSRTERAPSDAWNRQAETSMMGLPAVVGRLAGGAGVAGVAAYQPMVLLGIGVFALLLAVGVVLPAVWSRDLKRQEAAARVLHVLLVALCGDRFATALKTSPPNPATPGRS